MVQIVSKAGVAEQQIEQKKPIEKHVDPVEMQVVSVSAKTGAVDQDTEKEEADPHPHPEKRPALLQLPSQVTRQLRSCVLPKLWHL